MTTISRKVIHGVKASEGLPPLEVADDERIDIDFSAYRRVATREVTLAEWDRLEQCERDLATFKQASRPAIQVPLLLFTTLAITGLTLFPKPHPFAWWACLAGLASAPFWLYTTAITRQWGTFAVALWFAAVYAVGLFAR